MVGVAGCLTWTGLRHRKGESARVSSSFSKQIVVHLVKLIVNFLLKPQHDVPVRGCPRPSPPRLPPAAASGTTFERFYSRSLFFAPYFHPQFTIFTFREYCFCDEQYFCRHASDDQEGVREGAGPVWHLSVPAVAVHLGFFVFWRKVSKKKREDF